MNLVAWRFELGLDPVIDAHNDELHQPHFFLFKSKQEKGNDLRFKSFGKVLGLSRRVIYISLFSSVISIKGYCLSNKYKSSRCSKLPRLQAQYFLRFSTILSSRQIFCFSFYRLTVSQFSPCSHHNLLRKIFLYLLLSFSLPSKSHLYLFLS